MGRIRKLAVALLGLAALVSAFAPSAARAEKRIALVIGNAGYQAGALETPANDAGLIAQTLQAAGFDVVGARDLDQDSLRRAFRDFLEKATSSGPDTVAFVYVSGHGLQLEGENYFVPIDARIARDADIAAEALRMSDYTRPLAALKLKATIVVLDAARANQFAKSGPPVAGGLALVDPDPGMLVAFNAAPGTAAPEGQGPYGPYAQALAEMMREGGLPLPGVFDRTRLRVNEMTKGALVPWHASKVETALVFFERAADAPPPAVSPEQTAAIRARPMREIGPQDAYALALERDTVQGYSDFLAAYPDDPMVPRVRAIVAARREAITWRRTRLLDTPPAYWSYLRRYPDGPHAADAQRRLTYLAAALDPPAAFAAVDYELPPPPPEEIVYVRRPVLVFDDPVYAFAPPPPAPFFFLAPPPPEFVMLVPPPPPVALFVLPCPVYRPVPVWVRPPAYVVAPRNNVIFANVHSTVVVNNTTNVVTVTNRAGQTKTLPPPAAPAAGPGRGAPAGVAAVGPSLPPSVAQKAVTLQNQSPQGARVTPPGAGPGASPTAAQPGQPLPGMKGQPLPAAKGGPVPTTPTAAVPSTTPPPPGGAKPGMPPGQTPAAKLTTPTPPPGATPPGVTSPQPGGSAKPGTPPAQTPAAKLTTPTSPAGATPPGAAPPPPGGSAKPATPPAQAPAAKLAPPPPTGSIRSATPPPPAANLSPPPAAKPQTPSPSVARPSPPPSPPPAPPKPAATAPPPPPPAVAARPPAPPPQTYRPAAAPPPSAPMAAPRPVAPPPQMAAPRPPPQMAAPRPAPTPPPRGCPPGKTMVNGACR